MRSLFGILLSAVAFVGSVWGRAVTLTPQMGWNSWNKFACNISETLIKETADALVSSGLAELGYTYLNLDDCWHANQRDSAGRLQANSDRFPSGMKALGDYIHSKGLKFGIYSSAGFKTCQGFPASLGLEEIDAQTFADWGVDYLKYDNCYQDHGLPQVRYPAMADALEATGREMFYSLCEWGRENPAAWASDIGAQSWRISADIRDDWQSILSRAEIGASLWRYAGPGRGWNDPDMLEVGNGGCTVDEYRTHMSLWVMLRAPLLLGNDLRGLTPQSSLLEILGNKEVLAVHRDALGRPGRITWSDAVQDGGADTRVLATRCATGTPGAYEDPVDHQTWTFAADGTIANTATGHCLHEASAGVVNFPGVNIPDVNITSVNFPSEGSRRAVVAVPDCVQATRWRVEQSVGGAIVSQASGLCLEVEAFEYLPGTQGKRVQTAPCQRVPRTDGVVDVREHQAWTHPGNAPLRNLYQRQCLTVDRDAPPGREAEVWASPLEGQIWAVLLVNKAARPQTLAVTWDRLGWAAGGQPSRRYRARDLWAHRDLPTPFTAETQLDFRVPAHGAVLLRLAPL